MENYGLDPHTATHDMIIRNNTVYDNGSIGIICSLDCYNIIIENNKVYNNTKMGIMFSRNMYDSVARNNIVSDEDRGIVVSESHNNEIHNNIVSDSGSGIDLDNESSQNTIYGNTAVNITYSSSVKANVHTLKQNSLYSNAITKSDEQRINFEQEKPLSDLTSNISVVQPLKQVSVNRTINVTEASNPIMDAFYYLFGWK